MHNPKEKSCSIIRGGNAFYIQVRIETFDQLKHNISLKYNLDGERFVNSRRERSRCRAQVNAW